MPRFIRRVRRSLRRSRQSSLAAGISPTLDLQDEHDYAYAREHDRSGRTRSRPRTPVPLPVIVDRGPPTRNRYADDDLFWNSVMLEADEIRTHIRNRANTETNHQNNSNATASSYARPPLSHARTEADVDRRLRRRRGLEQLERGISFGRERDANDRDLMFYNRVDYDSPPLMNNGRSDSPISPGSKAYDDFMDFPFHESTAEQTKGSNTTTIGIAITTAGDQRIVLDPSKSSSRPRAIIWGTCLSETLNNRHIDPEMRQAVLDKIREADVANGIALHNATHMSMAEAGLVPNFSRPVVASGFYDRVAAQADLPTTMTEGLDSSSERHQNLVLYEDAPTPPNTNGRSSPKEPANQKPLPNGVSATLTGTASSSSSTLTIRPNPPSPTNHNILDDLNNILHTHLSQNQLTLLVTTLHPSPGALQSQTDPSTLITQLQTIILGLSDRIHHTEETLLPSLSHTLTRKTKVIDLLLNDIKALKEHIDLLEKTIDFGNNVLEGTWARTYETLRTLGSIKRKRHVKKWWDRRRGRESRDRRDRRQETDEDDSANGRDLSKRELAAMFLMARQNVDILAEDIEDMMNLVELCQDEQPVLIGVDIAKEVQEPDEMKEWAED